MKKRIVVVCPGRGSYTKENLKSLTTQSAHAKDFVQDLDQRLKSLGQPTVTELDTAATFSPSLHTKGEHASTLIYACSYSDFMAIDREKYEIVAITGNSMGWYLALAFAGCLNWANAFTLIHTMGSMMKQEIIGGQVIYPICEEDWRISPAKLAMVQSVLTKVNQLPDCQAYISIVLGGYLVLAGNRAGVSALLKSLPQVETYPFQLINHAAFHTPLLEGVAERAFQTLPMDLFEKPKVPLIDGRGAIWQPYSTAAEELYAYTLGHQVVATYDFSQAISVALKEFAPDHLVLLGPGSSLGASLGQILIQNDWYGLKTKAEFTERQKTQPLLLSMGRPEQRALVVT